MVRMLVCYRRRGISNMVTMLIMLVFTISIGIAYAVGVQDIVAGYLDVLNGEIVGASAIHRNETLHVRVDFRHIMGSGFDRIAISEFVSSDIVIERFPGDLVTDHTELSYDVSGWSEGGTACDGTWRVLPWPAAWPALPTTDCDVQIYQRASGETSGDGILVNGGDTITVEIVVRGITAPAHGPDTGTPGVSVEYGVESRTATTGDTDVSMYIVP